MCILTNPLIVCATSVVTFTLAAIAVYRCIMIQQPYRHRPTKRVTYVVIACSWVWSVAIAMPSALARKISDYTDHFCILLRCDEEFSSDEARYLYSKFLFTLQIGAPFIVMVVSYSIVVLGVKKHIRGTRAGSMEVSESYMARLTSTTESYELKQHHAKEVKNLVCPAPAKPESPKCEQENLNSRRAKNKGISDNRKMIQLENDVLNMIYIIIVVFFLFYLPSQIVFILIEENFLNIKKWDHYHTFSQYLVLLHAIPSALHPIFYGTMSKVI
jgi:hypothetical protein